MKGPTKVSRPDALAIGAAAVLVRLGGTFAPLLLEFLSVAVGAWCLLAVAENRPLAAAVAATAAWTLWWCGRRLDAALNNKPLDRARL
jgi:hypothetical protein